MGITLTTCDSTPQHVSDSKESPVSNRTDSQSKAQDTSSSQVEPVKKKEIQLSKNGIGDILVNQAFYKEMFSEIKDSRLEDCFYATSKHYPEFDLDIQIIANKVAVISTTNPQYLSYTGVKVGDAEAVIYERHPNKQFEKVMNPYGDGKTQYSIFYWDDAKKQKGIRYDVDQKKVTEMYMGNNNLDLMEGCA